MNRRLLDIRKIGFIPDKAESELSSSKKKKKSSGGCGGGDSMELQKND